MSPHVFEIDKPTEPHYKMPINAISSIASRVTGCVLSGSASLAALAANTPHCMREGRHARCRLACYGKVMLPLKVMRLRKAPMAPSPCTVASRLHTTSLLFPSVAPNAVRTCQQLVPLASATSD